MQAESTFRALSDPTRLRIVKLLGAMELAVGELAQVLGQSQPRVSRHVGILCDAGLAERRKEGSWVFLRAPSDNAQLIEAALRLLQFAEIDDVDFMAQCHEDAEKLSKIRSTRQAAAEGYFAQHAENWDELRSLHSPDQTVENALIEMLADSQIGDMLDIGTGTGRMVELFAGAAERVVALDNSLEMLRIARARLQDVSTDKLDFVQGDFSDLPFAPDSFDTVMLHQVLHFAQVPAIALQEAGRVLRAGGRIAIVDFAAHDREELRDKFAHARLGFADEQIDHMLREAGFEPLDPVAFDEGELVVKIWIGERLPAGPTAKSIPPSSKEKSA